MTETHSFEQDAFAEGVRIIFSRRLAGHMISGVTDKDLMLSTMAEYVTDLRTTEIALRLAKDESMFQAMFDKATENLSTVAQYYEGRL